MEARTGPQAGAGMAGGQPVPLNQQRLPLVMNVANFLRSNKTLKMRTGLMNNKEELDFFRFKRLQRALLSDEYKQKSADPKNQLVQIKNEQDVAGIFVKMIQARLLVPVDKLHYQQIKEVKGWKPNKQKPTLRPSQQATVEDDAYYVWVYQKPNPYMLLYAILMLVGVFAVVLFPLWPVFMRVGVWYCSMGLLGLLGLFFAMAFVRLIIFVVTYLTMPQAFWLYPNLFADCGFFESFQPVYSWSKTAEEKRLLKEKKKNRKQGSAKIEEVSEEAGSDAAVSSGVEKSTGATKRTVTLESVDE